MPRIPQLASRGSIILRWMSQGSDTPTNRGCECAANYMLPTAAAESDKPQTIEWDNGFRGSDVWYRSNDAHVNVRQEPYSNATLLPDGSRQYEVAHMVRVYDSNEKVLWPNKDDKQNRDNSLNYRVTIPS